MVDRQYKATFLHVLRSPKGKSFQNYRREVMNRLTSPNIILFRVQTRPLVKVRRDKVDGGC